MEVGKKPREVHHREGRLQAECVLWYRNIWYKNPKHLWATFNEGKNVNTKFSLGLIPGVSDLLYYEPTGRGLVGIEMKFPGETHEVRRIKTQAQWLIDVCSVGYFCDSLEMFQSIITGGDGIDPSLVLSFCSSLKTASLIWNNERFE